ncbi:FlgN family protein [Thermodesulfatator indicus DSM 15286]|uniref:FlgN family protein n=1 Tax=Thermodesulfatator indicus (strain DSM 15286 / JCM 11887 / CIR29812) TaxID=667014 RepID=F8AAR1_THEID|nr:FlgN family protein [Thermodesulfatator indicus]AEH44341.1 FlgN family protein [Thermodesulfatator indicus DSM 15286]
MKNPWQRLVEILEKERKAIISGDIEKLLDCLKEKEVLLKDPGLKKAPLSRELRQEITRLSEHNQMLLKAGLAFIEEAYRFLGAQLSPKGSYSPQGKARNLKGAQLLSVEV